MTDLTGRRRRRRRGSVPASAAQRNGARDAARRRRLSRQACEALAIGLRVLGSDIQPPGLVSSLDRRTQRQLRSAVEAITGRSPLALLLIHED
jgi:hypothetical protein